VRNDRKKIREEMDVVLGDLGRKRAEVADSPGRRDLKQDLAVLEARLRILVSKDR
jgi:hypothetical protein